MEKWFSVFPGSAFFPWWFCCEAAMKTRPLCHLCHEGKKPDQSWLSFCSWSYTLCGKNQVLPPLELYHGITKTQWLSPVFAGSKAKGKVGRWIFWAPAFLVLHWALHSPVLQGWGHCLKPCCFVSFESCIPLPQFGSFPWEKCSAFCLSISPPLILPPCLHSPAMELAFHPPFPIPPSSQPLQQLLLVKCFFPLAVAFSLLVLRGSQLGLYIE